MKQFLQKHYLTKVVKDTVKKKQLFVVLPFLGFEYFLVSKDYKVA